jgi:hypothetical protein
MVVALEPRNFALKPRTKFRLKFVRECQNEPIPFPCRSSVPGFKYKTHGGFRDLGAA